MRENSKWHEEKGCDLVFGADGGEKIEILGNLAMPDGCFKVL